MVCPMLEKRGSQAEASSEYPYEPIYRPWSWILSSSTNLFLFAAVVCLAYMLYKRRKARGKRRVLTYRVVEVNKTLLESEEPTKINALVTGGSGRLGREVVSCLLKNGGYKVHSLDLFIPEEENRNSEVCSYIQADITNYDDLHIAMKDVDVVFHTAAIIPTILGVSNRDYDEVNWKGTQNVIAACKERKVKRLIYTSTVEVVLGKGHVGVDIVDEDYPFPEDSLNAYIGTKREAEKAVLAANDEGLKTCAVRPGSILESMVHNKLARLTYLGEKGKFYPMTAGEDVAKVQLQLDQVLVDNPPLAAGKVYIIATTISERELAETVATELDDGQKAESFSELLITLLTYVNVFGYWLTGTALIHPQMTLMTLDFIKPRSYTYSCARAQKELGWKPSLWKHCVKRLVKEWKETKKDK